MFRGPNLAPAQVAVENLMDDACVIQRNPRFLADDTLNDTTGALVAPGPELTTIYDSTATGDSGRSLASSDDTGGKCTVTPIPAGLFSNHPVREGGAEIRRQVYRATVPIDAPEIRAGDYLTVTGSRRDPSLVGQTFTVETISHSTFAVSRKLTVELPLRVDAL